MGVGVKFQVVCEDAEAEAPPSLVPVPHTLLVTNDPSLTRSNISSVFGYPTATLLPLAGTGSEAASSSI